MTGDTLPFSQPPHWLMLAPISAGAKTLYTLLVMHVNREDPANRTCWPEQQTLAEMMGFTRHQSVAPYIDELERLGAMTVDRVRNPKQPLRKRNYYHMVMANDPAPAGIVDLALTDWYRRNAEEFPAHPGSAVERTSAVAGEPDVAESEGTESPEVRSTAPGEVRPSAPSDVRSTAQELEELELDQGDEEKLSPANREVFDAASAVGDQILIEKTIKPAIRTKAGRHPAELKPHPRRTTTDCKHPGCKAGAIYGPETAEHPHGTVIRCPACWTYEPETEQAA
jgi:hypothetical protein